MSTIATATEDDEASSRTSGAAPPPFHQQRRASVLLAAAAVLALLGTVAVGLVVHVPTFTRGLAVVEDDSSVAVLFPAPAAPLLHPGVEVRVDVPGYPDRTWARVTRVDPARAVPVLTAQLHLPQTLTQDLTGTWVLVGLTSLRPSRPVVGGTQGSAVARVGRRPLGALLLGHGLEVDR